MKKSLLFLLLSIVIPIQAANIYVKPASLGGNDETGDGITWETAYATPIKAFSEANTSGDVIAVMQGTYTLTSSLINAAKTANVKLQGGYTGVDNERVVNPFNTIFEYAGTTTVRVLADYGAGLLISGITFQNLQPDASQYGVFVNIAAGANLSLEDCIIKNFVNKAGAYVRGIIRFNGTATLSIDRSKFIDCEEKSTAAHNAVITRNAGNANVIIKNSIIKGTKTKPFITSAASGTNSHTITNCNFINNPGGAGVNLSTYFATIIKNSIFYNSTLSGGGTLSSSYYNGSIGTFTINNSVLFAASSDVFADETNFYPAVTFAGVDNGDNTVVAEGDRDIAGNNRLVNSTVDIGAYENIEAPVGVVGSNVISVGAAASSFYSYGATSQIPVKVSVGCVPDPIEGVLFTGTAPDYTASVIVKTPQTITFTATLANYEISVSATNVTVTSPTLVDGKYSSASSSIIYFTLNEGTENPVATVNGSPLSPVLISGNNYSLTLSDLTDATNVVISASVKVFDVTLSKNAYVASLTGLIEGTQQKEYGYSDLTFSLVSGAHSPYVAVNDIYIPVIENGGVYSITGFRITDITNISISAFPENVIPVSEDTWTNNQATAVSNNSLSYLTVRNTLSAYSNRRAYLRFALPVSVKNNYSKVELKLYTNAPSDRANNNVSVRTVIPTIAESSDLSTVTWANSDAVANEFDGTEIAVLSPVVGTNTAVNTELVVNLTDHIFNTLVSDNVVNLQIATNTDGYIHFKSLENGNPAYVPALVFSTDISTGNYSLENDVSLYYYNAKLQINNLKQSEMLQIKDMSGRKVYEELLKDESNTVNCTLAKGIYIVKVGSKTVKLLVNN